MYPFASILFGRQEAVAPPEVEAEAVPECEISPADLSYLNLRIASIFVIFIGSAIGAILPILLAKSSRIQTPKIFFFITKFFGTGVILATAWMHLLSPAIENLSDECLGNILPDYDWAMGIGLMTVMVMFLVELIVSHFDFGLGRAQSSGDAVEEMKVEQENADPSTVRTVTTRGSDIESAALDKGKDTSDMYAQATQIRSTGGLNDVKVHAPGGQEHLNHRREHVEGDNYSDYAAQMTAIFILEFGIIFHSIFIGLTLAVADGFIVLFIVLVFHQTFEGFGLGSRLATAQWPTGSRRFTPYILALAYAVSTPLAIAIGLGVRESLSLDGATAKIVNGVLDAISGGILMYTGLVELLAHEFMFNAEMRKSGLKRQLHAYACVALGVGLMALLAKWA